MKIYCVSYFLKVRDVVCICLLKNIDKFDKIRELPTNGGLTVTPPPPCFFLHTLHLPAGYVPDGGLHLNEIFLIETKMQKEINRINHQWFFNDLQYSSHFVCWFANAHVIDKIETIRLKDIGSSPSLLQKVIINIYGKNKNTQNSLSPRGILINKKMKGLSDKSRQTFAFILYHKYNACCVDSIYTYVYNML